MADDLVVALTGASGAAIGVRLVEVLLRARRTVHLTISPAAVEVFARELGRKLDLDPQRFTGESFLGAGVECETTHLHYHHFRDFSAGIASGSFLTSGMIVCPCSMGTLAAISHGQSENLIHRAADVHLKERRKLILVPRETPLSLIALRNMVSVTEAGAIVLPAMPGYYSLPLSVQDMIDFVVGRVCDQINVDNRLLERWGRDP